MLNARPRHTQQRRPRAQQGGNWRRAPTPRSSSPSTRRIEHPMPSVDTPAPLKPQDSTIKSLQLNTHRSHAVLTALFNDPLTLSFHFLLIQEPPVSWYAHKAITEPNWHAIEPLTNLNHENQDDARIKSIIYVNSNLASFSFSPIITNSFNIAGVKLLLPHPHPPLHLFSVYLPPNQTGMMDLLRPVLTATGRNPVVVGMDSNLHHPMWNPPSYTHTH